MALLLAPTSHHVKMATMNMRCASGVAAQQQATRQTPARVSVSSAKPIVRLVPFQVRQSIVYCYIRRKAAEDLARVAGAEADTAPPCDAFRAPRLLPSAQHFKVNRQLTCSIISSDRI